MLNYDFYLYKKNNNNKKKTTTTSTTIRLLPHRHGEIYNINHSNTMKSKKVATLRIHCCPLEIESNLSNYHQEQRKIDDE